MDKVAVVVLNWNGIDFLKRFLPNLAKRTIKSQYSLYLADNGSSDDSLKWTRSALPEVNIIELDRNYGFAEGYNRALAEITAEYYLLINSDIDVAPGWIDPLISYLEANPSTAICQPKILSEAERDTFEYAGAAGGFIDKYGYPFCRGRVQSFIEKDRGQFHLSLEMNS